MLKGFLTFFKYTDEIYKDGQLSELESEQKRLLTKNDIINSKDSELKKRIFLLYYDKLPILDKNLYTFMSEKVEPEVFLLKWYICIFTREFPINQVVHLWDLILVYEYIEENLLKEIKKEKEKDNNTKNKIKKTKNNSNEIKEPENFYSDDNLKTLNEIITDKNINNDNDNNKEDSNIKNDNNIILEENNKNDNDNKEEASTKNNKIILEDNKNNDNIFDDKKFCFIDYIILSMILKIKNLILKKRNSSELMAFLMKYPQDIDLVDICLKALDIYYKFNPNVKI